MRRLVITWGGWQAFSQWGDGLGFSKVNGGRTGQRGRLITHRVTWGGMFAMEVTAGGGGGKGCLGENLKGQKDCRGTWCTERRLARGRG